MQPTSSNPILKWYSLTQIAEASGWCYNSFKKYYLWQMPEPTITNGPRKKWAGNVAEDFLSKMQSGEISAIEEEDAV